MSDSVSNMFQKGSPRAGQIGPTQTSEFSRRIGSEKNQEKAALLMSGGRTSSLFLTGASKIFSGIEGLERAKGIKNQAKLLEFDAKQSEIQGQADAADALERLNDVQAANIVATFASGIALQGSATRVQETVAREADYSIAISNANAELQAAGFRRKAREQRDLARRTASRAKADIGVGIVTSAASLFL